MDNALGLKLAFTTPSNTAEKKALDPKIALQLKVLVGVSAEGFCCGAPEGKKLEPSACALVLEELENWAEVLKSEPEVIHRLAAFAGTADGGQDLQDAEPVVSSAPAGPSA